MKSPSYFTRALRSADPRYARILDRLGYGRRDMQAAAVIGPVVHESDIDDTPTLPSSDEIAALRAEYKRIVGTRPFHGWDAAALRERIAKARGAQG
jgi:hypothetical protein